MKPVGKLLLGFFVCCMPIVANAASSSIIPDRKKLESITGKSDQLQILDRLFGRLKFADTKEDAEIISGAIWKAWSRSKSPTATILLRQVELAMAAKQYETAIAIATTIIEQNPEFAEAWNKRATLYFLTGDYDRSLKDIAETLKLEPRHFGALSGMGHIYHEMGKEKKAISAFRRALAIHPFLEDAKQAVKTLSGLVEQDI